MKTFWILAGILAAGTVGYMIYQRMKPTATQTRQQDTAISQYGG